MQFRHRLSFLTLTAALLACRDVVAPELPAAAEPFAPSAAYAEWWAQIEECSGRTAPFTRVNWFVVPDVDYFVYQGREVIATWLEYRHQIIVSGAYIDDGMVVRHEMLHDLLNTGKHPQEYFGTRCGHLIRVSGSS
jgi:hypothetical protein